MSENVRVHKHHRGQRCRILRGIHAGKIGTIRFDVPTIGCPYGDEWYVDVDGLERSVATREHDIGPAEPEPAARKWFVGDRVKVVAGPFVGRRGVIREVACPTLSFVNCDDGSRIAAYPEDVEPIGPEKPEPSPPPATILYRVEYPATDEAFDDEGNPGLVTSRRAALVPIAGRAERAKLAEVLEMLHDLEGGHDDFVIRQIGGVPADPYAVGDRVAIVGGEYAGEVWHLAERDAANGQRWWLSREPGGAGWLGLHCDRFTRDRKGDS